VGFVTKRTSDLSGTELPDDQVVTVVVKQHPDLADGKIFDAAVDELLGLKGMANNLVQLEIRSPDGTTADVVVTKSEFTKLVSKEKLDGFDSARGRRTGYKPSNGTNGA
jgi:hypothetical protein